jgi:hypothetical protein
MPKRVCEIACQIDNEVIIKKDIGHFQISMKQVGFVERSETNQNTANKDCSLGRRQGFRGGEKEFKRPPPKIFGCDPRSVPSGRRLVTADPRQTRTISRVETVDQFPQCASCIVIVPQIGLSLEGELLCHSIFHDVYKKDRA